MQSMGNKEGRWLKEEAARRKMSPDHLRKRCARGHEPRAIRQPAGWWFADEVPAHHLNPTHPAPQPAAPATEAPPDDVPCFPSREIQDQVEEIIDAATREIWEIPIVNAGMSEEEALDVIGRVAAGCYAIFEERLPANALPPEGGTAHDGPAE